MIKVKGIFSQKTHRQSKIFIINPPHRGPKIAPISAEAPIIPYAIRCWFFGNEVFAILIASGIVAPAAIACNILLATRNERLVLNPTSIEVIAKTINIIVSRRLFPNISDNFPTTGIIHI